MMTESNDGIIRLSVRIDFRVSLDDLIEVCLQHKEAQKSKTLLIKNLRRMLRETGESLADWSVFDLALQRNFVRLTEVVEENEIEQCKRIVLSFFPELEGK